MNMQTRITGNMIATRVLGNLQRSLSQVGELQEQLSSGKVLNRPSDSPTGTVAAMQLRSEVRSVQQYDRNATDAAAWLATIDTTLTAAIPQVTRVRDLTLQAMSAATGGTPNALEALAAEVDAVRESMISIANTSYLGRPVFGGTTSGTVAFNPDGSYAGNTDPVLRKINEGDPLQVDANGETVFGTGAGQLFAVMEQVADDMRNNPAALGANLALLNTASTRILTALADVGARYNRVEQTQQTGQDRLLSLQSQLSDVEDIDLPATIMEMQLQQSAYEAALGASAKVMQPSLMDFLR
ncbi:MAG TPA: flagellar hook-associated protein FlgL [Actinoplanes sp.]|nr:flagellar hook-associated protein FlgL [Actinoplanes sp.]